MNNWHVLVVEDDRYGSEVVISLLNYHHISADIATSAEEALLLLNSNPYTMALIDLNLPGKDGWSLLQSIRANDQIADLPCVAMTAYHDAMVAHQALQAGFVAYFSKPLNTGFAQELEQLLAR